MPKGIYLRIKPVWNKGLTRDTDERVKKISESLMGKKLSKKHRENVSKGHMGQKAWNKGIKMSDEFREKCRQRQIGKKDSMKTRIKKSLLATGEKEFTGFRISKAKKIRTSNQFKEWRKQVFERDNYTCQNFVCKYCNDKKRVILNPHHIIPMKECLDLDWGEEIFDVDNGITYCMGYHLKGVHQNG